MTHLGKNRRRTNMAGFSLIELMIAMVLGLLVLAAAGGIFLSNQRAYQASEGLGRMQENSQVAFEMLSRDLREVGASSCDSTMRGEAVNLVATQATTWYADWANPLKGYDGGGLTGQVAGTDAIQLVRTDDDIRSLTASGVDKFDFTPKKSPKYDSSDILMICDMSVLGIFQAGAATDTSVEIASSNVNNCNYLPVPSGQKCGAASSKHRFQRFALLSRLRGVRWLVRANPSGGKSLYRQVDNNAAEEIIPGVRDLQIEYLGPGGYTSAGSVADWNDEKLNAVKVTLTLEEMDTRSGTGSGSGPQSATPLVRTIVHVTNLRNRSL